MTTFPVTPNGADHVLVASPSNVVRERVLASLQSKAGRVEQAQGGAEALVHLENGSWQVLFLDRRLPDLDAEELSQTVRARYPALEVVLLDNEGEAHGVRSESEEAGLALSWPVELGETNGGEGALREAQPRACCSGPWMTAENGSGVESGDDGVVAMTLPGMVGTSAAMQSVSRMARLVAPRDTTVLITGPTGCGKELVARALHQLSPRAARTFAVVNCAAIPETMLEAELFGYSRGAFTGAMQSYAGRIQGAHLGTLFLDEIGDMPLSLQPKLLRFLEQKELQRLGSAQVVRVDARVVAATNVDLLRLVDEGKFREDLYYRLAAFPLEIPALEERPGDVIQLARHFLEKFSGAAEPPILSEEACARLGAQRWPGNVRELQNAMERALILANGERLLGAAHFRSLDRGLRSPGSCR